MSPMTPNPDEKMVCVRLKMDTAIAFEAICREEYRPVAAELRRLVEQRIAEYKKAA